MNAGAAILAPMAIILTATCCSTPPPNNSGNDVCGLGTASAYFTAHVGDDLRKSLREAGQRWTELPASGDEELQATRCCDAWRRQVMSYCEDTVTRFCDENCSDETHKAECKNAKRTPVRLECARQILPVFRREASDKEGKTYCEPMDLQGELTVWPWDGGTPQSCPKSQ
jgi:hypothetical protein